MSLLLPILLYALLFAGAEVRAGQTRLAFEYDGVTRSYELYLPPALLVVLHGLRGSGRDIARLSGFNEYAYPVVEILDRTQPLRARGRRS